MNCAGLYPCGRARGLHHDPRPQWSPLVHVTEAESLFSAVADAIQWFADDFWHGPKPTGNTTFEVSLVGDDRCWQVHAASVELAARSRMKYA